ncbi:MAG: dihydrodipicolinate reductase [Cyanobacteria bacterium NC_groundwater_1444_Ag_S-0.65um_54_12]|nr:dihydrodipicolinate reductase [Cyanobacteria bacterium NC_groundwater_1444_Ag_S-0.65um_54_12]
MVCQEIKPTCRQFPFQAPTLSGEVIPIALYGLGSIGMAVARAARERHGLAIKAAIDVDPVKVNQDLGTLLGEEPWGVVVNDRPSDLAGARVVLHTTGSFLDEVLPQLQTLIEAGGNIVSSTEELAFPYLKHAEKAHYLDSLATKHGVAVVGVGVNPGFAMDVLPLVLSAACQRVDRIRVRRMVNTTLRRFNLQKKTGAGMTCEEFAQALKCGRMGHIGLAESAALLAHGLGWRLRALEEEISPVVAKRTLQSEFITVAPGLVAGLRQVVKGKSNESTLIELDLTMALGDVDDLDEVLLNGRPDLRLMVPGGLPGDLATVAALLNTIPRMPGAKPGLRTMLDLTLPHLASLANHC